MYFHRLLQELPGWLGMYELLCLDCPTDLYLVLSDKAEISAAVADYKEGMQHKKYSYIQFANTIWKKRNVKGYETQKNKIWFCN